MLATGHLLVAWDAQDPQVFLMMMAAPLAVFAQRWLDVIDLNINLDEELFAQLATEPGRVLLDPGFCLSPTMVRRVLRRAPARTPPALTAFQLLRAPLTAALSTVYEPAGHNQALTSISIGPSGIVHWSIRRPSPR